MKVSLSYKYLNIGLRSIKIFSELHNRMNFIVDFLFYSRILLSFASIWKYMVIHLSIILFNISLYNNCYYSHSQIGLLHENIESLEKEVTKLQEKMEMKYCVNSLEQTNEKYCNSLKDALKKESIYPTEKTAKIDGNSSRKRFSIFMKEKVSVNEDTAKGLFEQTNEARENKCCKGFSCPFCWYRDCPIHCF